MEKLSINRNKLSEFVWQSLFENSSALSYATKQELIEKSNVLDQLRLSAKYNTGSISPSTIWSLFAVVNYFKPKIIAEVGTFIGKSTFAMACAMDIVHSNGGEIYTCDYSNAINLDFDTKTKVYQFQMKSSTEMFAELRNKNIKCDFLLLDGRLQNEDYEILKNILHKDSIILLDDFEGTEKGVINAINILENFSKEYALIYPPTQLILNKNGMHTFCSLGLIIPFTTLIYTNQ